MQKVITFALVLILSLSLSAPAWAENEYVEIENDVIRLRDDGSEQSFSDTLWDCDVILHADDIQYTFRQGPIYTTIDSVYIVGLTVHDGQFAAARYGAEEDFPFALIRLTYTVSNTSETKAVVFPGADAWLVTNTGELAQGRVAARPEDEDVPEALEPGKSCTRYLFFPCPDTWPTALSFFSVFFPEPWEVNGGAYGATRGICVELLETAM